VLNFLLKNAKIVAISGCFYAFGLILGNEVFDPTPGQEIIVVIASAACGVAILMSGIRQQDRRLQG
jgi:hypothetical protein